MCRYSLTGRPIISLMMSASLRLSIVSVATLLPSRKMVTRSQSARTSSSRCEMKMMVRPSSRRRRAIANRVATSLGVRGAVGSSMMMSRLSEASARAISTICWSAIDRPRIGLVTSIDTPKQVHQSAGISRHLGPRHPSKRCSVLTAKHEVFSHRKIRKGNRFLVDQGDAELLRHDRTGDVAVFHH